MKWVEGRELILRGARNAFPHAISASSVKAAGLYGEAERMVRAKLLLKSTYTGETGYRLPDPPATKSVIATRPKGSGAAYEREVANATKLLRQSLGLNAKKPPTRR